MHKLYKVAFHTLLKRIGPLVSQWSSCSGLLYPEWLTVTYLPNTVDGQPLHIVAAYCLAPTLAQHCIWWQPTVNWPHCI